MDKIEYFRHQNKKIEKNIKEKLKNITSKNKTRLDQTEQTTAASRIRNLKQAVRCGPIFMCCSC